MLVGTGVTRPRTATARGKAEQADYAAACATEDSAEARTCASNFAPEFKQPGDQGGWESRCTQ